MDFFYREAKRNLDFRLALGREVHSFAVGGDILVKNMPNLLRIVNRLQDPKNDRELFYI